MRPAQDVFPSPRVFLLLAALALLAAFVGLGTSPLWDQDESAYAGFARQMNASGDHVVPEFAWSAVHRKPPLLFWTAAGSFALLGESEFALRLPVMLAVLLTALSVWWLGRELVGGRAAALGALVLGTSLFVPNLGKVAVTDGLLLLWQALAALSLGVALRRPGPGPTLLFWTAVALGALTKGPPVLLTAGGLGAFVLLFHPRRKALVSLHPWFFLPLSLLPLVGWGYLAWQRTDGELIRWMWEWYVAKRAKGGTVFGQSGPPGYHLALMLAAFLPWSMLLPSAGVRLWRERRDPASLFLLGWLASGWLVWELLPSKLPAYALGAYPCVALLLGRELEALTAGAWQSRSLRWGAGLTAALGAALSMGLVWGASKFLPGAVPGAALMAVLLTGGIVWTIALLRGGRVGRVVPVLAACGVLVSLAAWTLVVPALDAPRDLGRRLARRIAPDVPVAIAPNLKIPSIPFYLGAGGREVALLGNAAALREHLETHRGATYVVGDRLYAEVLKDAPVGRAERVEGVNLDDLRPTTLWIVWDER